MGTLAITKSYAGGEVLMEADIDAFRTGLHTLFNTDKLGATNFSGSMALTSAKFTGVELTASDDEYIQFGAANDAKFGLDSSKNLLFNASATMRFYAGSTNYLEVKSDRVNVPGDILIGPAGKGVLQGLSSYRKPVLEWNSSSSVVLQNNSGTSNNSIIYFPTFVASVTESSPSKYRFASISVTANGYGTSDSGSAQGGRRSGVSATTNSWYYVYAAKVRSGTDFSTSSPKFIMVFDTTSPVAANISTLNTRYGTGCWVYLGLIRYGFGATGSTSSIIKFQYSNKGWCTFCEASTTGYAGLNLAYSSTDADNTASAFYTFAAGTSGNVIPETIGHVRLSINRARVSDWYIRETSSTSSDIIWRGGWQTDDGTLGHGFLVELPNVTGYSVFQERKSSNAGTIRGVALAGFCDTYMTARRHGHGI